MLLSLTGATFSLLNNIVRSHSFYTWAVGLVLGCLGTFLSGAVLISYDQSVLIDLNTDPFSFNPYLLFGLFLYLISVLCQPLTFLAIRTSLHIFLRYLGVIGVVLVIFLLTLKLIATSHNYLLRLFVAHAFLTAIIFWLVLELLLLQKNKYSIFARTILVLCTISLGLHLIWLIVILFAYFGMAPFDFNESQINLYDLNFRFIRSGFFIFVESSIFLYWVKNYSSIAIYEQQRSQEIHDLLLEKDKLISHLVNVNLLVETGALSIGLAHEINQFLARIQLNAEEALLDLKGNQVQTTHPASDSIVRILGANRAATELIKGLRQLFFKLDSVMITGNIDVVITEVIDIYTERCANANITIKANLSAAQDCQFSNALIRQVLGNLISNAIDALALVQRKDKKITVSSCIQEDKLMLEISDNGIGIDKKESKNIFELFKSTKAHGSGIGLWLCRHIISQHNGHMKFENHTGGGVSFFVIMPVSVSPDSSVGFE